MIVRDLRIGTEILSGPAITVTAIVPALAQFYVARVKYPRWPAATAPHDHQ